MTQSFQSLPHEPGSRGVSSPELPGSPPSQNSVPERSARTLHQNPVPEHCSTESKDPKVQKKLSSAASVVGVALLTALVGAIARPGLTVLIGGGLVLVNRSGIAGVVVAVVCLMVVRQLLARYVPAVLTAMKRAKDAWSRGVWELWRLWAQKRSVDRAAARSEARIRTTVTDAAVDRTNFGGDHRDDN